MVVVVVVDHILVVGLEDSLDMLVEMQGDSLAAFLLVVQSPHIVVVDPEVDIHLVVVGMHQRHQGMVVAIGCLEDNQDKVVGLMVDTLLEGMVLERLEDMVQYLLVDMHHHLLVDMHHLLLEDMVLHPEQEDMLLVVVVDMLVDWEDSRHPIKVANHKINSLDGEIFTEKIRNKTQMICCFFNLINNFMKSQSSKSTKLNFIS